MDAPLAKGRERGPDLVAAVAGKEVRTKPARQDRPEPPVREERLVEARPPKTRSSSTGRRTRAIAGGLTAVAGAGVLTGGQMLRANALNLAANGSSFNQEATVTAVNTLTISGIIGIAAGGGLAISAVPSGTNAQLSLGATWRW